MSLIAVKEVPGLWRAEGWQPGMPGLYALVIGISAYPFLEDGPSPAAETFGLGQLQVSAQTAAAVFRWLAADYRRESLPVAWAQLLLSPTAEEKRQLDAWTLTHFGDASNRSIREAIQLWSGNLPADAPAAQASRSFLFFSGHGVQANWHALLLPADYLDPRFGKPVLEACLSAREIGEWMQTHPAAEHVAFFDACRNEFSPLASKGATAHAALPVNPAGGRGPRVVARMAATAPDMVAYQAQGPGGMTFFGQALLEGLKGQGQPAQAGADPLQVEFQKLVSYVKPRVNALLKQRSEQLEQPARPSLEPSDETVILAEVPAAAAASLRSPVGGVAASLPATERAQAPADVRALAMTAQRERDRQLAVAAALGGQRTRIAGLRRPDHAQALFGHEYATDLWRQETFLCLNLRNLADETENGAVLIGVERREDSSIVQVDLELEPGEDGRLLVFRHPQNVLNGPLVVPLPTDPRDRVPVRLTLRIGVGADWKLRAVEARLGPSARNRHYAYLWEVSRVAAFGSLADAAEFADPGRLRAAVEDKRSNPTAACAGALILARGGRIRDLGDWPRNLMDWFPALSDGAVLWAEALRAQIADGSGRPFGVADPAAEMARALALIEVRGVPLFGGAIELAGQLLGRFERGQHKAPRPLASKLRASRRRLDQVQQIARWSGSFLTAAGLPRPPGFGRGTGALSIERIHAVLRPT